MDFEKLKSRIVGPAVGLVTPLKEDFSLDLEGLKSNIQFALRGGLTEGRAVLMSATAVGEAPQLSLEERKAVIKTTGEEAAGKVLLATSSQDCSLGNAIELSNFAEGQGFEVVQVSPPFYATSSPEEFYNWCRTLGENINIGMMIYNTTWLANWRGIDVDLMNRLLEIENIVALKWSSPDWITWLEIMRNFSDRVAIVDNGFHGMGAFYGARAVFSYIAQLAPEYILNLWSLQKSKKFDESLEELHRLVIPLYRWGRRLAARGINGSGTAAKAVVGMAGLAAGPCKPPYNLPIPEGLKAELKGILTEFGIQG